MTERRRHITALESLLELRTAAEREAQQELSAARRRLETLRRRREALTERFAAADRVAADALGKGLPAGAIYRREAAGLQRALRECDAALPDAEATERDRLDALRRAAADRKAVERALAGAQSAARRVQRSRRRRGRLETHAQFCTVRRESHECPKPRS